MSWSRNLCLTDPHCCDLGWNDMPCHLLGSILDKVETRQDYLEFDVVCESWHHVAMTRQQRSRLNLLPQAPMLLVRKKLEDESHALYNVVTKTFSKSKLLLPHLSDTKRFSSFSLGWLFFMKPDHAVKLYKVDPDTDYASSEIGLPHLIGGVQRGYDYHVTNAVITADPLTSPDKCVVAAIVGKLGQIAFTRPNIDRSWTFVRRRGLDHVSDILYYDDKFYALRLDGVLFSFKVNRSGVVKFFNVVVRKRLYRRFQKVYLFESHGSLFMVLRYMTWKPRQVCPNRIRKTLAACVFKLDMGRGIWFKVRSIGDNALFLGDNISISISCSNFPGYKPDCIYFSYDNDSESWSGDLVLDFGRYDLQRGTMKRHFGLNANKIARVIHPIWVIPYCQ